LISQIEASLDFIKRHTNVSYTIDYNCQRSEIREYPGVAIREAVINALVHRDYCFQNSCVYIHIFSDRLEIEKPGGIAGGIALEELDGRSIRRNPLLADLLCRAGYGEKLGSGMIRIQTALRQNGNPP
jgi:ATP-dependent DNA helicase RecG